MKRHSSSRGSSLSVRGRIVRAVAIQIACLAALLVTASVAAADNVVYVGADGNVFMSSPDGSVTKQLTSDATAESKYRSPSQKDDGTVVAIRKIDSEAFAIFLDPQTGQQTSSWILPSSGLGAKFAPFTGGQISPDGGLYAYDYFHAEGASGNFASDLRVGFAAGPGLTDPCTINCESGFARPRWIPGTSFVGMVDEDFDGVFLQTETSPQPWFGYLGFDLHSFDFKAGKTVVAISPETGPAGEPDSLAFEQAGSNTPTPATTTTTLCSTADYAPAGSVPRLSRDASMIAWTGAEGVFVSPAPVPQGDGSCALSPKLIASGGTAPDWGPLTLKDEAACAAAEAALAGSKSKLKKAKAKLKKAKSALEEAEAKKEIAEAEELVAKAKKKVKKAKANVKRAAAAVDANC